MLTLAAARPALWRYGSNVPYATATADDIAEFDAKLNATCERFLRAGHSDKVAVALTVYEDVNGNPYVTEPYGLGAILAAIGGNGYCGSGLKIRSDWYEYLPNSIGLNSCLCSDVIAVPGRFTTYQDWNTPMRLRVKMEKAEETKFIFRGKLSAEKIYTDDGGDWIEGVALTYVNSTVTTTQLFDEPPYTVIKPVTQGRVTLWAVDSDNNETQVAEYQPTETIPRFRRYRVPSFNDLEPNAILESTSNGLPSDVYSVADIDAMFGRFAALTVNATGTHDLAPNKPFAQWFQRIITQDNGGTPYTHTFTLDNSEAKEGAIFRIAFDMDQSADATIQIFDDTVLGTQLGDDIVSDISNARHLFKEYLYNGTTWEQLTSSEL